MLPEVSSPNICDIKSLLETINSFPDVDSSTFFQVVDCSIFIDINSFIRLHNSNTR